VCLGSASKTFWGGLRVGWVRAEPELVRRLVLARALDDLGSPLMEQLATAHLLGALDGPDGVLTARRAALADRCRALTAAIAEHLPGWRVPVPDGGMVLWCTLPTPSSTAIAAAAREVGVTLTPGPRFGADGGLESRLRIPFSRPAPELEAAVRLIAAARPSSAEASPPESVLTV
jgi:DNA-binding transcriptional MocR family regulator